MFKDTQCEARKTNGRYPLQQTFNTSNYNYEHNVVLFIKDFICAPCIYNIKNNVVIILLKYVIYNTVNL
jgi:hypothetical protein